MEARTTKARERRRRAGEGRARVDEAAFDVSLVSTMFRGLRLRLFGEMGPPQRICILPTESIAASAGAKNKPDNNPIYTVELMCHRIDKKESSGCNNRHVTCRRGQFGTSECKWAPDRWRIFPVRVVTYDPSLRRRQTCQNEPNSCAGSRRCPNCPGGKAVVEVRTSFTAYDGIFQEMRY